MNNASYPPRPPHQPRHYINETGTGNTLNVSHPRVLQMVMDILRYWATEMGVDGFRFVLATILGREPYGFDPHGSRSEEHTSELQSLMRISYAVFCLKKKNPIEDKHTSKQTSMNTAKTDTQS